MRSPIEMGDIFRQYGPAFRQAHRLSMVQHKAMNAIEACRTAQLGGHVDQCDSCGHEKVSYNSCRNRHCPKCQGLARERWLEARKAELLAVKHFHIVFTLPHELHPLIRANEALCYNILFQAVSQTLVQLGKEKKILQQLTGTDPLKCPKCKTGQMRTKSILLPARSPPVLGPHQTYSDHLNPSPITDAAIGRGFYIYNSKNDTISAHKPT